jgi:hypothetical protein
MLDDPVAEAKLGYVDIGALQILKHGPMPFDHELGIRVDRIRVRDYESSDVT